jgi:predicted PurR-regulated permease PerM
VARSAHADRAPAHGRAAVMDVTSATAPHRPTHSGPMPRRGAASLKLRRAGELSLAFLLVVAAVAVIGYAISRILLVVMPIVAALLLATLFAPPARRLERLGWPPALATATVLVFGVGVLGGLAYLLVPPVVGELSDVGAQASQGVTTAQRWLTEGPLHLSKGTVGDVADAVVHELNAGAGSIGATALGGALVVTEAVAAALMTVVLLVFFVKDGPHIWAWLVELLPSRARPRIRQAGVLTWQTLTAYVRGIAVVAVFDSVFIGLAMLAVGVPLVLPLMALVFFGAFVPLIGATVAGVIIALVTLVAQGLVPALVIVAAIIAVQQIEGHVLYPVVVGRALSLHPVAVVISVALGTVLLGIVGAFVAVPVAAVAGRVLAAVRSGAPRRALTSD